VSVWTQAKWSAANRLFLLEGGDFPDKFSLQAVAVGFQTTKVGLGLCLLPSLDLGFTLLVIIYQYAQLAGTYVVQHGFDFTVLLGVMLALRLHIHDKMGEKPFSLGLGSGR